MHYTTSLAVFRWTRMQETGCIECEVLHPTQRLKTCFSVAAISLSYFLTRWWSLE